MERLRYGIIENLQYHARQTPKAFAAYHGTQKLSYGELEEKSEFLAHALLQRGIGQGSRVVVCIKPGFDILYSIYAIFRCGAGYLPMDPNHPSKHIERILREARPDLILTHRQHADKSDIFTEQCLFLDEFWTTNAPVEFPPLQPFSWPSEQAAFLMYTSGTTGSPKGVLISMGNLLHFLWTAQNKFKFTSSDIFCNVARYTFSISFFDLLVPGLAGGAVRLLDREHVVDFKELARLLSISTVFHAGPSLLATFFQFLSLNGMQENQLDHFNGLQNLRHVSSGGDTVLPAIMCGMREHFPNAELFVIYGCTEIGCMGTYFSIPKVGKIAQALVGNPFPDVSIRLLDGSGSSVNTGDIGEICFSGPGIGLGYLNNSQLNLDKFPQIEGVRSYCTGDFGRINSDGQLEFLGRRDFQVQLRGVRLELTAIENCIVELKLASHCAVTVRTFKDSEFLVAFLAGAQIQTPGLLRKKLAEQLPEEFLPNKFVFLDALPVTFNGKLDRSKLVDYPLNSSESSVDSIEMSNLEEAIAKVMCRQLFIQNIGLDQNFFDLGGHSLLGVSILLELKNTLAIELPPAAFFELPTVRNLARLVESKGQGNENINDLSRSSCNVIALNSQNKPDILFLLSGVHLYRNLVRHLDPKWSVLAMMSDKELSSDLSVGGQQSYTLEELAQEYTDAILRHQTKGPYMLLGFSFAGILAYEVAQKLTNSGHIVKQLILLDAMLPEWIFRWRFRRNQIRRLFVRSPGLILKYIVTKMTITRSSVTKEVKKILGIPQNMATGSADNFKQIQSLEKERGHFNRLLAENYLTRMKTYPGSALLFVSAKRLTKKPLLSRSCGWKPYISQLEIVEIHADHLQMLEENVSTENIAKHINQLAANHS